MSILCVSSCGGVVLLKLYLWEYVDHVSDNWHPEGGLVVIAEDMKRAMELIYIEGCIKLSSKELEEVIIYDLNPLKTYEEKIYVFPDAGCC